MGDEIILSSQDHNCEKFETTCQTNDERILQPARAAVLPLLIDGHKNSLATHANQELRPLEPGYFRLVLNCPIGTNLHWINTRPLEINHTWSTGENSAI